MSNETELSTDQLISEIKKFGDADKKEEKLGTPEEEIKKLKTRVESLHWQNRELRTDVKNITTRLSAAEKLLNGEALLKVKEDAKLMHKLYKVVHLKNVVATEVYSAYSRRKGITTNKLLKMNAALMLSYDYTNDWWEKRDSLTVLQWIKTYEKIISEEVNK